jgi:hypothetical protein
MMMHWFGSKAGSTGDHIIVIMVEGFKKGVGARINGWILFANGYFPDFNFFEKVSQEFPVAISNYKLKAMILIRSLTALRVDLACSQH